MAHDAGDGPAGPTLAVTTSVASALGKLLGAKIFRSNYGELRCAFHVEPRIMSFHVVDQPQPRFAVIQASARRFAGRDGLTWVRITDPVLSQCGTETRVVTVDRRSWQTLAVASRDFITSPDLLIRQRFRGCRLWTTAAHGCGVTAFAQARRRTPLFKAVASSAAASAVPSSRLLNLAPPSRGLSVLLTSSTFPGG